MLKNGSLTGIKILDLSRLLPGPFCSMILADHGARVISIEDKKFKSEGLYLSVINRNKEHITLDLKTIEGKEIFFNLAKDADVVIEGFRPGVVKKLGVDYESVKKINNGIIYCSITGYGQTGSFRDKAGHDANYLSYSGVLDLIGESGFPPSIPGVQFADIAGGGMNAAIGILLALFSRSKTGRGQYIDISMTDGMVSFLQIPLLTYLFAGQIFKKSDSFLSHRFACYNTYETSDNRFISIGAVENRFWKKLCEHLRVPEYILLQYDDNKRLEIIDFMRKTFKSKTIDEWEKELSGLDVCFGKIQNIEEVIKAPLFKEREMIVKVKEKDGKNSTVIGVPVKLSDTPGSVRTPPVKFGENTKDILIELGYSDEKIKEFFDKGAV